MQVILIQDVANLGYKNDVVKVKDGYGRNYLIPNKLAIIASESNLKVLAENLKQQEHKAAKLLAEAQATADKLAASQIAVPVKANEDGKIFGTVTTVQLAEALEAAGIIVDKRVITIKDTIKELGNYSAEARLHREVKAEFNFNVVAE